MVDLIPASQCIGLLPAAAATAPLPLPHRSLREVLDHCAEGTRSAGRRSASARCGSLWRQPQPNEAAHAELVICDRTIWPQRP
jgi:hypothetical protein